MRHLTQDQAVTALRRGKAVEQLLNSESHADRPTVRWLSVFRRGDEFVVNAHYVYDEGNPGFLDLGAFEPVDEDEYAGEGEEVARHPEPEGALGVALGHGAVAERWVNQGVVADEYADAHGWN